MSRITENINSGLQKRDIVLITGGSSGLGRALALLFASDGYNLLLVSRDEGKLKQTRDSINQKFDVAVNILAMDLADQNAAKKLKTYCESKHYFVEILVNNAGFAYWGGFFKQSAENMAAMINLHILTSSLLTRFFGEDMRKAKRGKIVQIASTAAYQSGPYMATYFASKAYLLYLSEAIRSEKGAVPEVQVICPGAFNSEFKERAEMKEVFFFRRPGVPDTQAMAKKIYKKIRSGQPIYVPGFANNLILFLLRFFPRNIVNRVIALFLFKE